MEYSIVFQLLQAIPVLEAQEQIRTLKSNDFPTMTKEARSKYFKALNKQADHFTIEKEDQKPMTSEQLALILNQG